MTLFSVRYDYTPFYQGKVDLWPLYRNAQAPIIGDKLRKKYSRRVARLKERIRRGEATVEQQQQQASGQKMQTAISLGATVLSAFLGRRKMRPRSVRSRVCGRRWPVIKPVRWIF